MRRHWRLVTMALRASVWRASAEPPAIGLAGVAGWSVAAAIAVVVMQYLAGGGSFTEYGLGLTAGWLVISVGVSALVLRAEHRASATAATLAVSLVVVSATCALIELAGLVDTSAKAIVLASLGVAVLVLHVVWVIGAYAAVIRSFSRDARLAGWGRATALWAAQLAVLVAFPNYPAFVTKDTYATPFNSWTFARAFLAGSSDDASAQAERSASARIELAQPALMEDAIARLAPQVRGETDVYAIGIAGWSEQDVFIKELDGALAALGNVLPVRDRTLRLVNHADTVDITPVALRANFAAAVRAAGRAMDRDEDVLLLFMTSHGSPGGFALRLPGVISTTLAPEDVADVLDREGIKNRIVVVSACYAGIFIKPLANDNTIVLTAADAKSPSFGCSNEREWTYFGDAFFNQHLRPDVSLEQAFRNARATIGEWEARDGLKPSNPQGYFGSALTAKLARIYGDGREAREAHAPAR